MCVCVGDRGDVTPVPHSGSSAAASASGAGRDPWRASVTSLLRHASHLPPLPLLHSLHTVLKVRCSIPVLWPRHNQWYNARAIELLDEALMVYWTLLYSIKWYFFIPILLTFNRSFIWQKHLHQIISYYKISPKISEMPKMWRIVTYPPWSKSIGWVRFEEWPQKRKARERCDHFLISKFCKYFIFQQIDR